MSYPLLTTPGPWRIGEGGRGRSSSAIWSGKSIVCRVYGLPVCSYLTELEADPRYLTSLNDARLIAAAPRMAEALLGIRRHAAEMTVDLAAAIQEGEPNAAAALNRWQAVLSAVPNLIVRPK